MLFVCEHMHLLMFILNARPLEIVRAFAEACLCPHLRDDVVPAITAVPARTKACFDACAALLSLQVSDVDTDARDGHAIRAWIARVLWALCRALKRAELMKVLTLLGVADVRFWLL